jgi:HEAT repeat protein
MRSRPAIILAGALALAVPSCGREERGPLLAGGREVKSWVEALKDADPKKRRIVVMQLGNVGDADPAAAEGLAGALLDADDQVRRDAVLAVAKLKSPGEAIMARLRAMGEGDRDPRARDLAKKAVARLATSRE